MPPNPNRFSKIVKANPEKAAVIALITDKVEEAVRTSPAGEGKITEKDLEKKERAPTKAERAVALALAEGAKVFLDPDGLTFLDAPPTPETGRRTFFLESARPWLNGLLYDRQGIALSRSQAEEAEAIFAAIAFNQGEVREVFVRLAHHEGEIFLDLGTPSWDVVRISPSAGWEVVRNHPVRFIRPASMAPLPTPSPGSSAGWEAFRDLMHKPTEEAFVLLVSWLVGTLSQGPYTLLALAGEQGTGKTTQGRVLTRLVDPKKSYDPGPPKNEQNLLIQAKNGLVSVFDNLSGLSPWLSDTLCRLATGAGYNSRTLYTNAGESIISARRPVILTSIGSVTDRGDLADRSVPVRLPVIPKEARLTEADVFARADKAAPAILGALLDAAAVGLARMNDVRKTNLPRMADFARWVMACEPALPWEPGRFMEVYQSSLEGLVFQNIEGNPFASALLALVEDAPGRCWEGGGEELLRALRDSSGIGDASPIGWPKTPRALASQLDRVLPLLRSAHGFEMARRSDPVTRRKVLTLWLPKKEASTTLREASGSFEKK